MDVLMLLALLGGGAGQFDELRHVEPDLLFDDLEERDVRCAHIPGFRDQRTAQAAGAGIELAHAARDEIDQNVGIANFLESFLSKFSVQGFVS